MNRALDNYWIDSRLSSQRPSPRVAFPASSREVGIKSASDTRARYSVLSSPYGIFLMIILVMSAICVTVTMRARAEMDEASLHYQKISDDVEALRSFNAALESEVNRLQNDPRAIESAARLRLGMLRPNEIVVTVE